MQHSKQKKGLSFALIVVAILIGGMMMATGTSQAAPLAQDSGDDDGALDNSIYIPFVASGADTSAAGAPLMPDQYDATSEDAPVLSDEQVQASTYCSTYIMFTNYSGQTAYIYWYDYYGREVLYYALYNGYSYWQQTYYGHSWVVRDGYGRLLKSFTVYSCSYVYMTISDPWPQATSTPTMIPWDPTPTRIPPTATPRPTNTPTRIPPTATPTNTATPQLGSIGDRVWNDFNRNGVQDAGEPGVAGVTVQLKNCSGNVLQTTTTDSNGIYGFSGLAAGCYSIGVVLPSGYTFSPTNVGNDNSDSDINVGTAMSDNVNLAAGQNITNVDAGINQPVAPTPTNTPAPQLGSIGDRVWNDFNRNGVQDAGEPGVAGVTVQLKNCSGNVLQTTTTDSNGIYGFSGLAAGCYSIGVVLPSGYAFSPANVGNDNTDSDINVGTAMSDNVNLAAGQDITNVDAGINQPVAPTPTNTPVPQLGSIGDRIWRDDNSNGQQDAGEPGVAGVTVQLKNCSGGVLQTTTTDSSGIYDFSGLAAGCYNIGVVLPSGYTFSPANVGNDSSDSDINPSTAMSGNVNLAAGENNPTIDGGIVPQGGGGDTCLGDYVWNDMDYDGIQDSTDMGVMNADIYLGVDTNQDNHIDRYVGHTTTDANGKYQFCGLDPNQTYIVEFAPPMGCLSFVPPNQGNDDTVDSDANLSGLVYNVVVAAGTTDNTIDAGLICNGD